MNFNRPLSWSAISSFEWDKEEWYKKYILNEKQKESREMIFGKELALSIEKGTCIVPGLLDKLQKKKEHAFNVMFGKIPLVGYADAFCDETFRKLDEVKTGKKAWDQKRVDQHGQLSMYLLMNYITNKIQPDDVEVNLFWIPTEEKGDFSIDFVKPIQFHTFSTNRTMIDILNFGAKINRVYKEMQDFTQSHE